MELGLEDKVAVVTGSSKGIGKAIAVELAREGCRVALAARGEKDLRREGSRRSGRGCSLQWMLWRCASRRRGRNQGGRSGEVDRRDPRALRDGRHSGQ